jgi:hypothetical protein
MPSNANLESSTTAVEPESQLPVGIARRRQVAAVHDALSPDWPALEDLKPEEREQLIEDKHGQKMPLWSYMLESELELASLDTGLAVDTKKQPYHVRQQPTTGKMGQSMVSLHLLTSGPAHSRANCANIL